MQAAGGALHVLNGNHETMSVGGRYTYATAGAVQDYERWQRIQQTGAKLRVGRRLGTARACAAWWYRMLRTVEGSLRRANLHMKCWVLVALMID